jgi:hypothetical protein
MQIKINNKWREVESLRYYDGVLCRHLSSNELTNIEDAIVGRGTEGGHTKAERLDVAIATLEKCIDKIRGKDQWIRVEDEHPSTPRAVLVLTDVGDVYIMHWSQFRQIWVASNFMLDNITHWHELPKPPIY